MNRSSNAKAFKHWLWKKLMELLDLPQDGLLYSPGFRKWRYEVESALTQQFGPDSLELKSFREAIRQAPLYGEANLGEHLIAVLKPISFDEGGTFRLRRLTKLEAEALKAFVAHGGESRALDKLCDFLSALGIEPLVVEELPSRGKALDDKVEYYLGQADCVVILATADDEIQGKFHPRQNVIHEIGLAQKTFPEKIIYLLEENTEFPSNVSSKVWQRFTQNSMDEAFIVVARELKSFGLIQAVKPQ